MRNPLELLPKVPELTVSVNGGANQFERTNYSKMFVVEGGQDQSPAVTWSQAPAETKSFVVSMYDPDAPTQSGFWHWFVKDIPADQVSLPVDAENMEHFQLPQGAKHVLNDARTAGYIGVAPPAGETHRYYIVVSALDMETLEIEEGATPAQTEFFMREPVIARGHVFLEGRV